MMKRNSYYDHMTYRPLGKTGINVSSIGMGCEYIMHSSEQIIIEMVQEAYASGINYIDLFAGTPHTRTAFGKALKGIRDNFYIAGHLGAGDKDGQYIKLREKEICIQFLDQFYEKVQTDYIDVLFLHNCDSLEDLNEILDGWMYEYALDLKSKGKIGHIGLSGHNTRVALEAVNSGKIEVLMFPVNPLFNMLPLDIGDAKMRGRNAKKLSDQEIAQYPSKSDLYCQCEKNNVGIVAMKPYAAGNVLKGHMGGHLNGLIALTPVQAISYVLSYKQVACPVPGFASISEMHAALDYLTSTQLERDFSEINNSIVGKFDNRCMYCNHCQPCPVGLDIAVITRLVDQAKEELTSDLLNQYRQLEAKAEMCIHCGNCTRRCPFGIDAEHNIDTAKRLFKS